MRKVYFAQETYYLAWGKKYRVKYVWIGQCDTLFGIFTMLNVFKYN